MKVAFVVHDCHQHGGHERISAEVLRRVAQRHETHLFACSYQDQGAPIAAFHRIRSWERPNIVKVLLFLAQTRYLREAGPFDLVHGHGLCFARANVVTAVCCQAARLHQVPVVARGARRAYQRSYLRCTAMLERHFIYRHPEVTVAALSDKLRRELSRYYCCPARDIRVVYPGVDSAHFSPDPSARQVVRARLGLDDTDVAVLFIGTPDKGLDTLLDALGPVVTRNSIKLIIAGGGDPNLYTSVIKQRGAERWTRFLGHVSDIAPVYTASDIFIFLSRNDAFGLVVLEAMASGLPVVVSRCAGAHEIVQDGLEGIHLRDPQDANALRRAILELVDDPYSLFRLGRNARERACSYTWDRTADQVLQIYSELVG